MNTALMIPDLEQQLAKAREGLANSEALASTFAPHFAAFREQGNAAMQVQPDQPKKAAAIRKALKAIRVSADKDRKALKEDALRTGKAIDGYHAILEHALVPVETAMREIEEAEERRETERRTALREARRLELSAYMDPAHMLTILGDLPEDAYQAQLAGAKAVKEAADKAAEERAAAARVAAAAAEAARLQREAEAVAERERLQREAEEAKEAARLAKVESDRKDEDARKAKEAADAEIARLKKAAADKAAADKAEQDKKDAEAQAERDRIAKEAAEREAQAKRAAAAPDREKLHAWAKTLRALPMPEPTTPAAQGLMIKITQELMAFADRVDAAAEKIGNAPPPER